MAARVFLFLVISVLAYRDGFCQEYALGKGRHLVEIGCKLPTPSTQCSMAVNYFAAALGFAAAGHCHLLKGKEKLSDADSEDCNKQLYFGT